MRSMFYVARTFVLHFPDVLQGLFSTKLLRAVKATALILVLACMQANAESKSQVITISLKNATLESVFKEINRQTGYSFVYNNSLLKNSKKIDIDVSTKSVEEVMSKSLKGQPFTYAIIKKTIVVKPLEGEIPKNEAPVSTSFFQTVKGRVTNSEGIAIAGVTVQVKGEQSATSTNDNGEFSLQATAATPTLVFTRIGYKAKEVTVQGAQFLTVILLDEVKQMEDLVITGVYNRKASSYTGATLKVTKEEMKRTGNANVFQALKNISPSMVLDNFAMGSNPNAMPDIRIRGTSSLPLTESGIESSLKGNYLKNPNEPLFILDGFETTAERVFDLDMNRIESITILKDASSKALYGSKAANGVIVIETIKLTSAKPLVSYNSSVDIDLPDLRSYNLTNAAEKLEAERIDGMYSARAAGFDPPAQHAELLQLYNYRKKLVQEGLNTYWLAKPLRDGIGHKHSLAVELGGDNLRIAGDLSYRNVAGVMKGSSRQNISGSMSTSYRLSNFLFRNITTATSNKSNESPYGLFSEYVQMNPYWRGENEDGTIPYYSELGPNGTRYTNPLYNASLNSINTASYFNVVNNFYLEWTIKPGLKAVTRVGIDVNQSGADEFYPSSHTKFENYVSEADKNRRGSYQVNNGSRTYLSGDFNLNYSREINRHSFFTNAGFNISEKKYNEVVHNVEGFASDRMTNITFGRDYALGSRPSGVEGLTRDIGFLGAASYTWDGRFLSDLTIRTNASSQFGDNKRWATFWSLGIGWNLHNENFLKNSSLVKQFKLRGSLGSTGNQNFNSNNSIATYKYYLQSLYQGYPGSYLTNMANPDLQWESKFDYNAGIDAKIKGLTLRLDYYESYTRNLVIDLTLPESAGFTVVRDNLGRVKNAGLEAYASYMVWSKGKNFINLNASIEANKNRIIELSNSMKAYNERMDKLAADQSNNKVVNKYVDGMSMDAIWAVPSLGIDPATGNEVYLDRNGHTTYNWSASDMVVVGNSAPKFQGIFGFNGEYKNFGLSVTGRYLAGGQMYNQTLVDRVENIDMNYNVDRRVLTGRWLQPGQQALFKRLGQYSKPVDGSNATTPVDEKTRVTSRFVQDRNEVAIGALQVYYDFTDMVKGSRFQRLRAAFNMNEIGTFSTIRIERGLQYPFARTLSFSLSATF